MINTTKKISAVSYNGSNLPLATQSRVVTPTTEEQVITGDDGYTLTSVTVEAVTKDIDSNIQSGNIKQGVSILGVEGVLEGNKLPDVLNKTVTSLTAGDFIGVTQIPDYIFQNCTSLVNLELPPTITSIGDYAFSGCNNIESDINLSNSLESIGKYAFNNCNKISGDLVISDNITEIPTYTFNNCKNIENIYIGENVEKIGDYGFNNSRICKSLTFAPNSKLSLIENYGFQYLATDNENAISEITLPTSLTNIGVWAFAYSNVKKINMSIVNIRNSAFYYSKVEEIFIDKRLETIESSAFYGCSGLTSITLPSSLTSIEAYAFYGCTGLTSITLPSSLTSIGGLAFYNCTNLITMRVKALTPPTLSSTNAIPTATTQIQVPMASVDAYKAATNWSNFADIIVGYTE